MKLFRLNNRMIERKKVPREIKCVRQKQQQQRLYNYQLK